MNLLGHLTEYDLPAGMMLLLLGFVSGVAATHALRYALQRVRARDSTRG